MSAFALHKHQTESNKLTKRLRRQQRKAIKQMLVERERKQPRRTENIFRELMSVMPSQLADRDRFDYAALGSRQPDTFRARSDWALGSPELSLVVDDATA